MWILMFISVDPMNVTVNFNHTKCCMFFQAPIQLSSTVSHLLAACFMLHIYLTLTRSITVLHVLAQAGVDCPLQFSLIPLSHGFCKPMQGTS